jgi:hypothetical protein
LINTAATVTDETCCIYRGLYALQLEPWLRHFPDQVKIVTLNDIKGQPEKVGNISS